MSLRTRIVGYCIGLCCATGLLLGATLTTLQWSTQESEIALRARTFAETVATAIAADLAAMRIEQLDRVVNSLVERNLEPLDIQFVAVVDSQNRILAHSDHRFYGQPAEPSLLGGGPPAGDGVQNGSWRGEPVVVATQTVASAVAGRPGLIWGKVVAGVGRARLEQARLQALTLTALLVVTTLIALGLLLYGLLEARLVRPIRNLTQLARRLAEGELSSRAAAGQADEIAVLGAALNDMAERIATHTAQLEAAVAERTARLEDANHQLAAANASLQSRAATDAMTGLPNFRQFRASLAGEVERSRRTRQPFCLLMVDVDHFKIWNDRFGHPAGDEVLRQLGSFLRDRMRRTDLPCRYGGEEFAVILPGTNLSGGEWAAAKLCATIEQAHIGNQPGHGVTVSIGVAAWPDHGETDAALIDAGDAALYAAKEGGRNRAATAQLPKRDPAT
ncbi:MAG: diguanylate cyclase [Deltaproteobacteria bacterium]|nr:diguanylate cyclase [Deltaproteobacteria bacterium]